MADEAYNDYDNCYSPAIAMGGVYTDGCELRYSNPGVLAEGAADETVWVKDMNCNEQTPGQKAGEITESHHIMKITPNRKTWHVEQDIGFTMSTRTDLGIANTLDDCSDLCRAASSCNYFHYVKKGSNDPISSASSEAGYCYDAPSPPWDPTVINKPATSVNMY